MKQTKNGLLILIILVGLILRMFKLGSQSFWTDEFYSVLFVINEINYYLTHDYGISYTPPLFYGVLWIFFRVFGVNELVARIPAFLFGVLTIPLTYLFGKRILGYKEGLVAAFIISLSPWHIRWSQEARMYTLLIFFTLLSLYCFYLALDENNLKFYLISAFFLILASYTHYVGILIMPILLFWLIFPNIKDNFHIKLEYLIFFISISILALIPLFLIRLFAPPFELSPPTWGFLHVYSLIISLFRYELGPVFLMLSAISIIHIFIKKEKSRILLVFYTLIPLFVFSLLILVMNVRPRYVILTLPGYALISADLIIKIFEYISEYGTKIKLLSPKVKLIFAYGFLVIILMSLHNWIRLYNYYNYGYHPDWKSACHYIKVNMKNEDIIASTSRMPVEYYLEKIDFVLNEKNAFENIKSSKVRVWLLIDEWRIEWQDPNFEIRAWILNNCIEANEVKLIKVYLYTP